MSGTKTEQPEQRPSFKGDVELGGLEVSKRPNADDGQIHLGRRLSSNTMLTQRHRHAAVAASVAPAAEGNVGISVIRRLSATVLGTPAAPEPEVVHINRTASTADIIRRSSDVRILGEADLRLAERVIHDRKKEAEVGVTTEELHLEPGHEDRERTDIRDDFRYNYFGLNEEKAGELLKKYGRNELVEKKVPLWYVFVSQLWQPM
jgi:hypothetical protein